MPVLRHASLCRFGALGAQTPGQPSASPRGRSPLAAFSLIELLVVVAIIAALMALLVPSIKGLVGVSGKRGGVDLVLNIIEQARLAAIENGVAAYAAFPPATFGDDSLRAGSVMVFRDKKDGDPVAGSHVALTKWLRLPAGVVLDIPATSSTTVSNISGLPKLGGSEITDVRAVKFDRFGRVAPSSGDPVTLKVGEGLTGAGVVVWQGTNAFENITIQRLTGRVSASSP